MEQHGGRQTGEGDGAGLNSLILLLLSARGEPSDAGGSSPRGSLARSLQKAEAMLRSCVSPGLRRLLPPRPRQRSRHGGDNDDDDEADDEDEDEAASFVPALEQSFLGLHRGLCVREDPRTETFHGHVRLQSCNDASATFSYHVVHPCVAQRGAALHALLQHRHHLRLARDYSRRLHAASTFLHRLLALVAQPDPPVIAQPLRTLCRELRAHAGHWSALRRRMRGDPWLRPLLLRRHEVVAEMRRALLLLALQAVQLTECHAEARLRALAWADPAEPPAAALLADLFQGLEMYNQAVGELGPELRGASIAHGCGDSANGSSTFPVSRVLGILAAERGRVAAERLSPLLQPWDMGTGAEPVCWEDTAVPWLPQHGAMEGSGMCEHEEPTGIATELQALCSEDEELMGLILRTLVASADGLWHHVLRTPTREVPMSPENPGTPELLDMGMAAALDSKSVRWLDAWHAPTAAALHTQYRSRFWGAVGTALEQHLTAPHAGVAASAAQDLAHALTQARVPPECEEELRGLCLRLLCQDALRSWERGFTRALGVTHWHGGRGPVLRAHPDAVLSAAAQSLQQLHPALGCALHCLHGCPPLRAAVLGCCVATAQATSSWLRGSACRFLAAWALPQFLLVTQGDLPVLKAETEQLVGLLGVLSGSPPDPGGTAPQPPHTPLCHWEHELCQQIRSMATSIHQFSGEVLRMFSSDCKRMAAEIFDQTMPQGRHWRLSLRAELPTSPSAYAAAAAQAVLGQVLQGAQLLPRDAQAPMLARVTTAFLEAWMDHILTQRIKFSLQGALQLRQDLEVVRELLGSERSGLAPETRQDLLSLRALQQMEAAIMCLLQQPGTVPGSGPRAWHALRRCCSDDGAHPQERGAGSLHGLDALEPPAAAATAETPPRFLPPVPDPQLWGRQQQWLSLRLHRARRWRMPGLPCVGTNPDA